MKFLKMLCCLLPALFLAGCLHTPTETVPTTQDTTLPSATQTVPTQPPLIELGAVNPLTGHTFAESPGVCILDERTVALVNTEYITGESAGTVTHLLLLDLYTDTVLADVTYDRVLRLSSQSYCPGFIPLFDPIANTCQVLDRELQTVLTFTAQEQTGVFAGDLSAYYYISGQQLYRLDPTTGESARIPLNYELPLEEITGYDHRENLLTLSVHTQYYLNDLCPGIVDPDTGEFLLLTDTADSCLFTGSGIALRFSNDQYINSNLTYTDLASDQANSLINVLPNDKDYSSFPVNGSDYLVRHRYDPKKARSLLDTELLLLGDELRSCSLTSLLGDLELKQVYLLPDGRLLGFCRERKVTQPVLICPEFLAFESVSAPEQAPCTLVDPAVAESYHQQTLPVEVAPELSDARALADQLEEEYGITILISNQCADIVEAFGYPLQPTDQAGLEEEARLLEEALAELKDSLALYPEGFFLQFRNEVDARGLLVLLVEDIAYTFSEDNVDVLGVTYSMGDWYPIAIDITTADLLKTYCHEIWHAIENKIEDEDTTALSVLEWNALNPEGFSYPGGITEGYYADTEHTFIDGHCGEESYFVDPYGKTSPYEDRARLMEYVMTSEYYGSRMMEAPALYEKMAIMIRAIRKVFDTTGWEDVHWERFHTP